MIVYRAARSEFVNDLTGSGTGGRWNSQGTKILYTAESKAVCMLEMMVHVPLNLLPDKYKIIKIEIPEQIKIKEINNKDLSKDWNKYPFSSSTQRIGDEFVQSNQGLILKVPSAIVPGSFNFLINPSHPDMDHVKIISEEDFKVDERITLK